MRWGRRVEDDPDYVSALAEPLDDDPTRDALLSADSILSLLRYRGIRDTPANRADVAAVLDKVTRLTRSRT